MGNGFFLPSDDEVFPDDGSTICSLCGGNVGPWAPIAGSNYNEPRPICAYCVDYVDRLRERGDEDPKSIRRYSK